MRRLAAAGRDEWQATVDGLLADLLPHVRVGSRRVPLEDCKAWCDRWDTYLSDGFQVWYLVHNEDCLGTGATCSSSRRTGCRRPAPRRCGWRGTASSRYSPPPARAAPPRRWTRPSCAPGTWTSGDMRPGECLVMSAGRLYHMSDFRVPRPRRRAVNFRVAVAPEGLRVAWGPWSPDSCLNRWRARRCRRGRGAGGEDRGLIYPGRYDLAA
ncbi:unnamed protein product [Prorocentrum cordatum]|uniref:Uncharacterized protein n=1 Tax=Prorocentrum cordatum TaxID=2364126 RepID=A0ABN9P9E1_9DINO|nr:unnamed protein product [Polarella glacialis]